MCIDFYGWNKFSFAFSYLSSPRFMKLFLVRNLYLYFASVLLRMALNHLEIARILLSKCNLFGAAIDVN
jgi:hypothetical protein